LVTGRTDPGDHSPRFVVALTMSGTAAVWRTEREAVMVSPADSTAIESRASAIYWAAIFGGAVAATAVTVVLVIVGSGFGLAWVSPIEARNPSVLRFALGAAIWLIVVQWIAALIGGFITGRLRVKWAGLHTHEVFFRDTAHGFLTWALSTLLVLAIAAMTSSALVGGGPRAAAQQGLSAMRNHDVDVLFRTNQPSESREVDAAARAEAGRILPLGAVNNQITDADRAWLAGLVAARAGLSGDDAARRVNDVVARETAAMEDARKAAAHASIMTGVAMLVGAFIACAAAAFGGSMRDEHI
jgi:hypothetical protein